MESYSFKIGTPKPVYFREYDLNYKVTDVDLEARIAMNVEVTDFDGEKYKDASEAEAAVKADKEELFQRCMHRLPEGRSVVKEYKDLISGAMSEELSEMGITAKTEVFSFVLTEDSDNDYREAMSLERMMAEKQDCGWDQMNHTAIDEKEAEEEKKAREAGLFKVVFQRGMFSGFSSEKIYYAPGEDVEVIYSGLMTDTSYTFYVTAKDHKVKYDDRNFYRISFVMPNHDVEVTCGIQSVMTCNYGADRNVGMMGLGAMQPEMQSVEKEPMPKLFTPKQPDEWFCTECGQKNKGGKFCRECGTKKYEKV